MDQIRKGLLKGIDLTKYIDSTTDYQIIQQIRLGLMHGLSTSQINAFNKPIYNYRQMSEIRNGLEQGLDINKFNDPRLTYKEMQAIRLGMLEG